MREEMITQIATFVGITGGLVGFVKVAYTLNNVYNHLVSTDKVVAHKLDSLDNRLSRLDDDVAAYQQENRDGRRDLADRMLQIEKIMYRGDWEQYVRKGIISKDQLSQIRRSEP